MEEAEWHKVKEKIGRSLILSPHLGLSPGIYRFFSNILLTIILGGIWFLQALISYLDEEWAMSLLRLS
jgi:hypothetical protein